MHITLDNIKDNYAASYRYFSKNHSRLLSTLNKAYPGVVVDPKVCQWDAVMVTLSGLPLTGEQLDGIREYAQRLGDQISQGVAIKSFWIPKPGEYDIPRFFARLMDAMIVKLNALSDYTQQPSLYRLMSPDFLMVHYGSGYGVAAKAVIDEISVGQLCICEPDAEAFALSWYLVDWEAIDHKMQNNNKASKQQQSNHSDNRLHFIIGGKDDVAVQFSLLWNYLLKKIPFFPLNVYYWDVTTLLEDSKRSEENSSVEGDKNDSGFFAIRERLQNHIHQYLSGWGNFDDELNQLCQAVNAAVMVKYTLINSLDSHQIRPVCIVGSGPSLDHRIEQLKEVSSSVIVVSCGSSITALYRYGVVPDIHIELESDLLVENKYVVIDDPNFLKYTTVITPIQANPKLFSRFGQHVVIGKQGAALTDLFSENLNMMKMSGVTCTNFAVQIMAQLGLKELYLIGFDYGFIDEDKHHSEKTIYMDDNRHEHYRLFEKDKKRWMKHQSVTGQPMITEPFFLSSKLSMDAFMRTISDDISVFNLSLGLPIERTVVNDKFMIDKPVDQVNQPVKAVGSLMGLGKSIEIERNSVGYHLQRLVKQSEKACDYLLNAIRSRFTRIDQQDGYLTHLNQLVSNEFSHVRDNYPDTFAMISGALTHFVMVGSSYYLHVSTDPVQRPFMIEIWRIQIESFLMGISEEIEMMCEPELGADHPWLTKSIGESIGG